MNYLAVLVTAVVVYVIGALWYSPLFFGKLWMQLRGLSNKEISRMKKMNPVKGYGIGFITTLVMVVILAYLMETIGLQGFGGLFLAFWVWFGFFATTQLGSVLWEGKKVALYLLNTAYSLVTLIIAGTILGFWV
jgi:hypothetical protein